MRVKDGYLLDMAARPRVFDVVGVKATTLKLGDTQLGGYFAFNLSVDVVFAVHNEHGMPPSRASVVAEALFDCRKRKRHEHKGSLQGLRRGPEYEPLLHVNPNQTDLG